LSLTEEPAAMWQKSAFAKREEVLVQLQEDFGFAEHTRMKRGGVIVVTKSCLRLAVDEFVDRLLHELRKVECHNNIRVVSYWGLGGGAGSLVSKFRRKKAEKPLYSYH
jgi:hypothetical protein